MGWLIALAIILLIQFMKISVRVGFDADLALTLGVGIFRIRILPGREKELRLGDYKIKKFRKNNEKAELAEAAASEKKAAKKANAKDKKTTKKVEEARREQTGAEKPERDIIGLVRKLLGVVKVFFSRFGHHLHIEVRRLVIIIATGDAAKTAVLYGAACGGVQCIMELLYNCMHLKLPKSADIRVEPDFLGEKIVAEADITFSFRVWNFFDMLFRAGFAFLKKVD